jgi:hypothetical protein
MEKVSALDAIFAFSSFFRILGIQPLYIFVWYLFIRPACIMHVLGLGQGLGSMGEVVV